MRDESPPAEDRSGIPPAGWLLLGALVLGLGYQLHLEPRYRFGDDDLEYAVPFSRYVARALQRGELPLWYPHSDLGSPFLARVPAMGPLYPGFALLLLLPPGWALSAGYALHVAIAGLGTFGLARRLGTSRAAAWAAALGFAGSTALTLCAHRGYLHHLVATAWLPAGLLAVERLASGGPALRWTAALGLSVGAAFLGGHTSTAFVVGLAIGVHGMIRIGLDTGPPATRLRRLALVGAGFALALAVAAAQLGPLIQASDGGPVAEGRAFAPWDLERVRPWRKVSLVLPAWDPGDKGHDHVGVAILTLALIALLQPGARPRSRELPLLVTGLLFGVLSLGPHTPLFGAAQALVPPLRALNYAYFFSAPYLLALALLAGLGIDRVARAGIRLPTAVGVVAGGGALLGIAARWVQEDAGSLSPWTASLVLALPGLLVPVLAGRIPAPRARVALLAALVALDVGLHTRAATHRTGPLFDDRAYFQAAGTLGLGTADPGDRVPPEVPPGRMPPGRIVHLESAGPASGWLLRRNEGAIGEFDVLRASSRLSWPPWHRVGSSMDAVEVRWVEQLAAVEGDRPVDDAPLCPSDRDLARLRALRVDRILTDRPLCPPAAEALPPLRSVDGRTLHRIPDPVPRVGLTDAIELAERPETRLGIPGWPVVHLDPTDATRSGLSGSAARERPGTVRVRSWTTSGRSLHVDTTRPALLVVADAAVEGWVAEVDGSSAAVLRADGLFVGVPVPAGIHRVELRFRPPGLVPSLVVSGSALLLAVVGLLRGRATDEPDGEPG